MQTVYNYDIRLETGNNMNIRTTGTVWILTIGWHQLYDVQYYYSPSDSDGCNSPCERVENTT